MYKIRHHLFAFICFFLLVTFGSLFAQENEVLLTIAGEQITKKEFLNVYNKNNRGTSNLSDDKNRSEQDLLNDYYDY